MTDPRPVPTTRVTAIVAGRAPSNHVLDEPPTGRVPGRRPPVDSLVDMSIFTKILRAGEGKKIKALRSLVPDINALEPEIQALSDDALKAKTESSATG